MGELKLCPFCGSEPKSYYGGLGWHVGCWNPYCSFQPSDNFDDEDSAIKIWNRRYKPPVHDVDEYYKDGGE